MVHSGMRIAILLGSSALALVPAVAQQAPATPVLPDATASGSIEAAQAPETGSSDIVVTGSRIRRSAVETSTPVAVVDQQSLTDRGFVSAAQALNDQTALTPQLNQAANNGSSSGNGQQAPSLFGLGVGRTLTLVNGRRMVTTASGLGDSQVDANIIPVGLLQRVEVVQGGGAAVYGSDAIAGVVNYVLKDHFNGFELDGQSGITSRSDYGTQSLRLTAGHDFAGGRGNFAIDAEYSRTPTLAYADRPLSNLSRVTQSNPADTGPNDGIPSVTDFLPAAFWEFNRNGVIFNTPAPVAAFLTRLNGTPLQFGANGTVTSYNPGTNIGIPFAIGGQGERYADLVGLRTGVDRITTNAIGHYEINDHLKLSTELLYARTKATEFPTAQSHTILGSAATDSGYIVFTKANPFLTSSELGSLSAASPAFAAGAPLFLSKYFYDLVPDNSQRTTTDTYRALLALDGDFDVGSRNFYYSASGSYARVDGHVRLDEVNRARFANAISAVRNSSGQIVCGINANASTADDDPACSPINPFGDGNVSDAARNYIDVISGEDYRNQQADFLATLGGSVFKLPAGDARFSAAYEHRDERSTFTPLAANQLGLFGAGTLTPVQSGRYHTNELSGELLVPIVGGGFTLPGVHAFELNGAYRYVMNSIAGNESVWNAGARWEVVPGITLRGSRSRNFRAPTLTQLVAPSSTALAAIGQDPCDADRINSGPNPTQRKASCLALFTANPLYGTGGTGSAAAGASAAARLAAFQDQSENFARTLVTTGGNPSLQNEVSLTWTYGVVLQPRMIPGLTVTADRVQINLREGLSAFATSDFAAACYDDASPAAGVCNAFTRSAAGDGINPAGSIITGTSTTFNAGVIRYRGETYDVSYVLPTTRLFSKDYGTFDFEVSATHSTLLEFSVTGATFTRTDNSQPVNSSAFTGIPTWVGRFDLRYSKGPFRFTYQLFYLDKTKIAPDATIENQPEPELGRNITHSISAEYDFGHIRLRGGITNLTDKQPSYPSLAYGDIIGRAYYVGATVKF